MDLISFTNLTTEASNIAIQGAAKRGLLDMWGGEETTLKCEAAETFANSFATMFGSLFVSSLAENIVSLVESAKITGTLISEGPTGPSTTEVASTSMSDVNGSLPNTLGIHCA